MLEEYGSIRGNVMTDLQSKMRSALENLLIILAECTQLIRG
jgi:hypothetical protein